MRYFFRSFVVFLTVSFLVLNGPLAAESSEGVSTFKWGVLYRGDVNPKRSGPGFPWNYSLDGDSSAERLAVMLGFRGRSSLDCYLKLSGGGFVDGAGGKTRRLMIDQAHVEVGSRKGLKFGLFSREHVFKDDMLLLKLTSNQSSIDFRDSFGGFAEFKRAKSIFMRYTHVSMTPSGGLESRYGLPPLSSPEGIFNQFRMRLSGRSGMMVGVSVSEFRSTLRPDNSILAADVGIPFLCTQLIMEFAKAFNQPLEAVSLSSEVWPRLGRISPARLSRAFNENEAFSVSLLGFEYRNRRLGTLGFEPSYTYSGTDFVNLFGELDSGVSESRAVVWWKHPACALMVDALIGDRYLFEEAQSERSVNAGVYLRFKGGIEVRERVICSDAGKRSIVATVVSMEGDAHLRMTGRVDGLGAENNLSFLSSGWINVSNAVSLGSSLFLDPSGIAHYALNMELRGGRSFLASVSYGSFAPFLTGVSMERNPDAPSYRQDRGLLITARFYMGSL